jgi:hypothetical protein
MTAGLPADSANSGHSSLRIKILTDLAIKRFSSHEIPKPAIADNFICAACLIAGKCSCDRLGSVGIKIGWSVMKKRILNNAFSIAAAVLVLVLSGCGGGGGGDAAPTTAPTTNLQVSVSGNPAATITQDMAYSFVPTATGPTGSVLVFSIAGLPAWANFDSATGALTGTPGPGDIRTYSGIVISVGDGTSNASLASFSINVVATTTNAVTLQWSIPMLNEDGSTLNDLAGFRVYYGMDQNNLANANVDTVSNPGLGIHTVQNLNSGSWFFVVTAYDFNGNESVFSNMATMVL